MSEPALKSPQPRITATMVDGSWQIKMENSPFLRPRDMNRLDHAVRLAYRASLAENRFKRLDAELAKQKLEPVSP